MKYVRATEKYEVAYPNPLDLKSGDQVSILKRETNPDWIGWVFCKDQANNSGWISEAYLDINGATAVLTKDYNATEISLVENEVVEFLYEEFGWSWVKDFSGNEGWVPSKILQEQIGYVRINQPKIETERLFLDPITTLHTQDLVNLFSDGSLHEFVPFEPPSFEQQFERCKRWAIRRSTDGSEIYLNWLAKDKLTKEPIGHFQAGVMSDKTGSIGYVVSKKFQNKGLALEATSEILKALQTQFQVKKIKAWTDTRNIASHRLAEKLGMKKVEHIKNADFFKGQISNEFVFEKDLSLVSVRKFDSDKQTELDRLYNVYQSAYKVEAMLLKIPESQFFPLKLTSQSIKESSDEIWTLCINEEIVAAIFLEKSHSSVLISNLVVDPTYFRRGYAEKLIKHSLAMNSSFEFFVGTGAENTPAIRLYQKLGFSVVGEEIVESGIKLCKMKRASESQ